MKYQMFDALPPHVEDALRASIQRYGVLVPVVRDQHGNVIDGHHRARIADELGVKYRVDIVSVANEDEARDIARHLNSRRRHLTGEQLREHIVMLAERTTPSGVGELSQNEIAKVSGVSETYVRKVLDDPELRTSSKLPDLRRGADGKVRPAKRVVAAKDSREADKAQRALAALDDEPSDEHAVTAHDVLRAAKHQQREQDKKARAAQEAATAPTRPKVAHASWSDWLPAQPICDLLITDPPYSTDLDDVFVFAGEWLPVALEKVKPSGRAYVCIGAYPTELLAYLTVDPPPHLTLANVLVWTYRNTLGPKPTHDYKLNWQAILYYRGNEAPPLDCPEMVEQFSVQDINAPDGRRGDRWHAWQKPDALAERLIRHASRPGDTVLDPFAGTGTFLLAAAKLGRIAAGCEVDSDNLAIAQERGCERA